MEQGSDKKKMIAKGDRLNWTPLKYVKPVNLSNLHINGKVLDSSDQNGQQEMPSDNAIALPKYNLNKFQDLKGNELIFPPMIQQI